MKRLILLIMIVHSIDVHGQDTPNSKAIRGLHRIQVGVNFSSDYCFRTLKNTDGSSTMDWIIDSRNKREIEKFGYSAGANVCINFTRLVGIETGIQYSNKGYQTKVQNLVFEPPPNPALPTTAKFIYTYHYIDIPLKVNFTAGRKNIRFFSSIGLTTNILLKATSTAILGYPGGREDKNTSTDRDDYKRINLSPMAGIGIDYKINNAMNVRVEPTFRYGVLRIIDAPLTAYLWTCGLNIGYYVAFK